MNTYIAPNTAERIRFLAVDADGEPLTGVTDLFARVIRVSDGFFWDWADSTFKDPATASDLNGEFAAVNATYAPGRYSVTWPGAAAGVYEVIVDQSPGTNVANVPATTTLRPISELQAGLATDVWAVGARTLTGIGSSGIASQASVSALPTAAANAAAVWDEALSGHATAGSAGAALALVDVAVSSRATAAGVWATAEGSGSYGASLALLRKHVTNRLEVSTASSGTETLYDDDATTPLLTWTLRDGTGAAITTPAGSPARRGAAT